MIEKNKKIDINLLIQKAKGLCVLYVEDEKALRDKLILFLQKIFDHVDFAANGEEALKMYLNNKYDIVITDIHMPIMDGLELIRNIHKHDKNQEIIINSAYSESDNIGIDINRDFENNFISYIDKPIDLKQILKVLNSSIEHLKS